MLNYLIRFHDELHFISYAHNFQCTFFTLLFYEHTVDDVINNIKLITHTFTHNVCMCILCTFISNESLYMHCGHTHTCTYCVHLRLIFYNFSFNVRFSQQQ